MARAQAQAVNAGLIGQPGSRERLATPALILDLRAFERKVARMARLARETGCALRPHAKAHKCREVVRAQVAAGAIGASCVPREASGLATLGLGDTVVFRPPHCDPTVNLFSAFHCVRGDTLEAIWPIEARGY